MLWLIRVRIVIITFLLGIQLAVAQLTQAQIPVRWFVFTVLFWYALTIFFSLLTCLAISGPAEA